MPDIVWRMLVWDEAGTAKDTISVESSALVEGAIAALTRFDVDGAGNCLEAEWTAVPNQVDVEARDIIQLQVSTNAGTDWTSVYKGVVVVAGAPREGRFRNYKAVGLKERLYEIPVTHPVVTGGDVSSMVIEALAGSSIEGAVTNPDDLAIPLLDFQLGDRFPRLETYGELFDALAESVGAFIAPAGGYTYDGKTWSEGEVVPAARWGVRADGYFFFGRPHETAVAVDEDAEDVLVSWSNVIGEVEQVADHVTLLYATEYATPAGSYWLEYDSIVSAYRHAEEPVPHPVHYEYDSGGTLQAWKKVLLEYPVDLMGNIAPTPVNIGGPYNVWTNVTNAADGDPATYAEAPSGITDGSPARMELQNISAKGLILRLSFRPSDAPTDSVQPNVAVHVRWVDSLGDPLYAFNVKIAREDTVYDQELILPLPCPTDIYDDAATMLVAVNASTSSVTSGAGARVYEVEVYTPDEDVADQLAQAHVRSPDSNASQVQLFGVVGDVSQDMMLTPLNESSIDATIERIEYKLDPDDGLVTTYFLGQAFDANQLSERAVLENMQKRIAKREARR